MRRPSVWGVVRAGLAVGLTAVMLWKADPGAVWAAARAARPGPILLAVALVLVDRALMAYRWLVLLRPFASPGHPSFRSVMRIFFVSTFVGTFLPASVGGDAVRAFALSREGVAGSSALASVVMDRMLGVLSVLLMAVAGLALSTGLLHEAGVMVSLAVTAGLCAVTALAVFSPPVRAALGRVIRVLPVPRVHAIGDRLLGAVGAYAARGWDLSNVLAGSLGVQVLRIVQAYLLGVAVGITAPLSVYFALIPVILLVMLLPVSINGIGVSQAAFVWFFAQAQVPGNLAFTLSVLFVALGIVGNLPGGLLYLTGGFGGERREER